MVFELRALRDSPRTPHASHTEGEEPGAEYSWQDSYKHHSGAPEAEVLGLDARTVGEGSLRPLRLQRSNSPMGSSVNRPSVFTSRAELSIRFPGSNGNT